MRSILWDVVADTAGNPISGLAVTVYEYGTTTPVVDAMYAGPSSVVPLANPLTTDSKGRFEAWINGGGKVVSVLANGQTRTLSFGRDTGGDPVSVKSYGAVADGVTDATAAIQAALNKGGTVVLPLAAGDVGYKLSSTVFAGDGTAISQSTIKGLHIIGIDGRVSAAPDPTVTKVESTLDGYVPLLWYGAAGERMLEARGPIQDVTIEGLGGDCRLLASCFIRTYDLQNSTIRNCKALNFTNCVSASGSQLTTTAGFDIRAYSAGDASPSSKLSSDRGSSGCDFVNLYASSLFGTRPCGFVVGSQSAPDPDGSGIYAVAAGSPDVNQCRFSNCINASANQVGSIGLAVRYADAITFDQCSFPAETTVSIEVPLGTNLGAFPNYLVMANVHLDNGKAAGSNGWNAARVVGSWTAEHKMIFAPSVFGLDAGYGPTTALGYGWTSHSTTNDRSGLIGNWRINGSLILDTSLTVGTSSQFAASGAHNFDGLILANKAIRFPAVQVVSTNPNELDDYEEGTFVPQLQTTSTTAYTTQTGAYIKVGRVVHFWLTLTLNGAKAAGSSASVIDLNTLPFASDRLAACAVARISGAAANAVLWTAAVNGSVVTIDAINAAGAASAGALAVFGTSTSVEVQGTFRTAN